CAFIILYLSHPHSLIFSFFFHSSVHRRDLPSFPTRRSSDLIFPDGQNRGRGSGSLDRGQFDTEEEVLWPDGCAAMYRKRMLDERSEEHTSELQSRENLVCRLLLEKKKK